jgi:hypothetical protein
MVGIPFNPLCIQLLSRPVLLSSIISTQVSTPNFDKILSNADGKEDNRCVKEVRIQNSVVRINKEYSYSYSEFCLLNSVFSLLIKMIK